MHVHNTARATIQARLHQRIILRPIVLINIPIRRPVREELPPDGEPEDVEAVVVDEVLHLARAVRAVVLRERRPRARRAARPVRAAPEVEAGDVHACEAQLACGGWGDLAGRRGRGRGGGRGGRDGRGRGSGHALGVGCGWGELAGRCDGGERRCVQGLRTVQTEPDSQVVAPVQS